MTELLPYILAIAVLVGLLRGIVRLVRWALNRPVEATATHTVLVSAPVEDVFGVISALAEQADWRRDVTAVRVDRTGLTWVETLNAGVEIGFRQIDRQPPLRLSASFASRDGFVGRREWWLVAVGGQTQATLSETIYTDRLSNRLTHQILSSPDRRVEAMLADLQRAFQATRTASEAWPSAAAAGAR